MPINGFTAANREGGVSASDTQRLLPPRRELGKGWLDPTLNGTSAVDSTPAVEAPMESVVEARVEPMEAMVEFVISVKYKDASSKEAWV